MYNDIEKELKYYSSYFKDKVVYCNTDSLTSNFTRFFINNFYGLDIRELIISDITGQVWRITANSIDCYTIASGDFRASECISLLQQCDIVVTNPPFSLFREFVAQLMTYNKDFLIIGNFNAVGCKEIFELFVNNCIRIGYSKRGMTFLTLDGQYVDVNTCWFTTLPVNKTYISNSVLYGKKYYGNEELYPHYVNYNAIEVSRVNNIPIDYKGVMGVPITYLERHNPQLFKIVGFSHRDAYSMKELADANEYSHGGTALYLKQKHGKYSYKRLYYRVLIQSRV